MSAPERTNGHAFSNGGGSPYDGPIAPPQNLEAEQSVLGAVLLSDTALPALIIDERLQASDFYREAHGRIYQAMLGRLLHAAYEIQAQVHGHEARPRDLVDMAERAILEVAHEDSRKDFRSIEQLLDAELDKLQKLSLAGTAVTGTPS